MYAFSYILENLSFEILYSVQKIYKKEEERDGQWSDLQYIREIKTFWITALEDGIPPSL